MNKRFIKPDKKWWGIWIILLSLSFPFLTACDEDDDFGPSIFIDDDESDPSSETYEFDKWLEETYLKTYNLEFRYRMKDISADMGYNLVPAYIEKSEEMARLIEYLWFGPYNKVVGENFLKEHGPRIIQVIGSAAYNTVSQTRILGTAEGGILVTLYDCNSLDRTDVTKMNEYYFNTMHHEFAHILHQKKTYPVSFNDISKGKYASFGWQDRSQREAAQLGFVSPYASSQPREDFVETISNYLVKSDKEWEDILEMAKDPNNPGSEDYTDGRYYILQKLDVCAAWLLTAWNIDIHQLKAEIQERQSHIEDIFKK